jgi:DNA-binding transcriptional ArsR family regulator
VDSDELDHLVRAVSNGTRRQILRLCADGFVSAGDIAAHIDLALAGVSEHLKVLRQTELVVLEREGTRWLYATNTERLGEVPSALGAELPADENE